MTEELKERIDFLRTAFHESYSWHVRIQDKAYELALTAANHGIKSALQVADERFKELLVTIKNFQRNKP